MTKVRFVAIAILVFGAFVFTTSVVDQPRQIPESNQIAQRIVPLSAALNVVSAPEAGVKPGIKNDSPTTLAAVPQRSKSDRQLASVKPPVAASNEGPRDLPDFEALDRIRGELDETWARKRREILLSEFKLDADVLARLDATNATYYEAKKNLMKDLKPEEMMGSPEVFAHLAELSDSYRSEVRKLIGEKPLAALENERTVTVNSFSRGGYTIPMDVF